MENSIELYRKELSFKMDFTLGAFYNLFCRNALYKINIDEFLFGLDRLDIRLSADEG
jgi:Ca2+-binding EF-hand superfamily protein